MQSQAVLFCMMSDSIRVANVAVSTLAMRIAQRQKLCDQLTWFLLHCLWNHNYAIVIICYAGHVAIPTDVIHGFSSCVFTVYKVYPPMKNENKSCTLCSDCTNCKIWCKSQLTTTSLIAYIIFAFVS